MAPGYSLTGIVSDQIMMLNRYGHEPHLFVGDTFPEKNKFPIPENITLHPTVPRPVLIDYRKKKDLKPDHQKFIDTYSKQLVEELKPFNLVITHDWIFTGWTMPYALVLQEISKQLPNTLFLHWIHSIPTTRFDWWRLADYGLEKNRIVFPNGTDAQRVALQYNCHITNVSVIPHIKDLRTWFDFSDGACDIINKLPSLMTAEVVQVYPASTDRLEAKRADMVIKLFAEIKKQGKSVCLLFANQEARNLDKYTVKWKNLDALYKLGEKLGLIRGVDFEFISGLDYLNGLAKRELRELFLCSNLFVYPTREESFGLVAPEAALSGAKLMVLNADLRMLAEVNCNTGMYAQFGSYTSRIKPEQESFFVETAKEIIEKFDADMAIQSATSMRRRLNYDTIYKYFYLPVIKEVETMLKINHIL